MTHHSLHFGTPIYCCHYLNSDLLLVGSGGGATKSGVSNKLSLIRLLPPSSSSANKSGFEMVHEHLIDKGEDAPMSMDYDHRSSQLVCGINSSSQDLKNGKNAHFKSFTLVDECRLVPNGARQTLEFQSEDDYQKITCFSHGNGPKLLAIGGTNNQLDIFHFPSLVPACETLRFKESGDDGRNRPNQLLSVDFDQLGSQFLVATTQSIQLFSIKVASPTEFSSSSKKKKKKKKNNPSLSSVNTPTNAVTAVDPPRLIRQIFFPQPSANQSSSFRGAKFGKGANQDLIYAVVNQLPASTRPSQISRRKKQLQQQNRSSMLIKFDCSDGKLVKSKSINSKSITSFDLSLDGKLIGFGSSDLSVSILDASSLRSLILVLHAHEFPVTCIRFDPERHSKLVSCSADMTIRVVDLLDGGQVKGWRWVLSRSLLGLIVLLIAFLVQRMHFQ